MKFVKIRLRQQCRSLADGEKLHVRRDRIRRIQAQLVSTVNDSRHSAAADQRRQRVGFFKNATTGALLLLPLLLKPRKPPDFFFFPVVEPVVVDINRKMHHFRTVSRTP